jgi:prepilin-type N-terminal cleavage/methylation domain-containing protein
MSKISSNSGFTLIESIIYLALFSIVIAGGMIAAYGIIQSSDNGSNHITLQEEANFILRKINWAMTGSNTITVISSPPSLSVTKSGLPILLFDMSSSDLRLTRGSGSPITLNSSNIKISNLSFVKITGSGKTDAVATSFTLTTFQNGRNIAQNFSTTKYLRK